MKNLFKAIVFSAAMLLHGCGRMVCVPPPPTIQFVLFNEQGTDVSKRYASTVSVYWTEGSVKRTEAVTAVPTDTSKTAPIAFRSYFPGRGMGNERTFYLDLNDGNTYPITLLYGTEKSPCGRVEVVREVRWNGKTAEKISIEPRYKFMVKGS